MSITKEDILGVANGQEQLDMYKYWSPDDDEEIRKDNVYKTPTQMVKEYHQQANLPISVPHDYFSELRKLREDLITEESGEVVDAIRPEEVLKELADLVYVTYGMAVTYGWDLEGALIRVHENNMGRMYQPDGTIKRREDGKIEKNKNYPKVKLDDLL